MHIARRSDGLLGGLLSLIRLSQKRRGNLRSDSPGGERDSTGERIDRIQGGQKPSYLTPYRMQIEGVAANLVSIYEP